ncbi:MtrB/PioB family decaheme-associated outer membrane protein [Shewanella sp. JM162201]|uniref:MtrB/PioB family decaheme-associated outer membrane protein n=1 Tax=Shewanella jiangmenensis TaxID=2837387 RepID=A0ABS5UYL2_9GAMM|nr:MtrB/PioB family decaheme-associated outer membrane protein [Shewanella jiangmenensis]MBT1443214.1 MtrB/PioB family decaheme-associated outer membrane protein [Shewanella jiangmenensis]
MNTPITVRLTLVSLAIAAALSPIAYAQGGYGLKDANRSAVKKEAWVCKGCTSNIENKGVVTLGIATQDGDDSHIGNTTGTDSDGGAVSVSGNLRQRKEDGTRLDAQAHKLGFDDGSASLTLRSPGHYQIYLNYQALTRFDAEGLTPYLSAGGQLSLPDDWQSAGTTAGMTGLANSNPVKLEKKRQRFELGGEVSGDGFDSAMNFRHETREGAQRSSVNLLTNAAMVAKPIDDSTDTLDASVSFRRDGFLGAINGQVSKYSNQYQKLAFDNAFYPTFGAAYGGQMAVDPDNQAFSLGSSLQFFEGRQQALMHLRFARMSQDEALLDATVTGPSPQLPIAAVDNQVDVMELGLRYSNRPTRELSLKASYDFRDRDNKTPEYLFPQVVTDSIYRGDAWNKPYDRTRQQLALGAQYRFSRSWDLSSDYSYEHNSYNLLSRDSVFEHRIDAALRGQILPNWQIRLIGEAADRRGGNYEASDYTERANQSAMRQYFLADRDKREIKLMTDHSFDALSLQFNLHTGNEDYSDNDNSLGLSEVRYTGFGLNGSYPIADNIHLNAFVGKDWRDSEQAGSSTGVSRWFAENRDENTSVSLGIKWDKLWDDKLTLGSDYLYSDGSSDTEVSQGLQSLYGPYSATRHTLKSWADYRLNESMSLRFDWIYEDYRDMDWANDNLAMDAIPNVILLGDLSHDYQAHYFGFSFSYQW